VLAPAVDPPNSSRQQLNVLDDLLQNSSTPLNSSFPMNNSFHAYRHVNPTDPNDVTYSLPKYLSLFVLQLMTKINDHPPPDNLAISLNPYISFDTTVHRYILTEGDISVQILRIFFSIQINIPPTVFLQSFSIQSLLVRKVIWILLFYFFMTYVCILVNFTSLFLIKFNPC
jgi:hypothetical protein